MCVCVCLHDQLERLGAEGHVEEAQELMKTVEQLEKERERERLKLTGGGPKVHFTITNEPDQRRS